MKNIQIGELSFNKLYGVDKLGNCYSKRKQISQQGKRGFQTIITSKWNLMKPVLKKNGYLQITIDDKSYGVHRLVALVFIPNINNLPEVDHKNDIKNDNRVENLYWGNQKTNARDRSNNGKSYRGENNPRAKITEKIVREIRRLRPSTTLQALADKYKVSQKLILNVYQRKSWKHVI